MIEAIRNCSKCDLCENQEPLMDSCLECQVFWVGLSAKKVTGDNEYPLSASTNTGKIISDVEEKCIGVKCYKTNLVKCVPLDEKQKLRYPNKIEINTCFSHLENEIEELAPRIVFLLGDKVASAVSHHFSIEFSKWDEFEYSYTEYKGTYLIPVHHPSYVYVYKRKQMDIYINSLTNLVQQLL